MTEPARAAVRALIAVVALSPLACRPSAEPPATAPPPSAPPPAAASLPAGHPPVGAPAQGGHGGGPVGAGGMSWTKPAAWQAEKPSSGMRQAQYRVSGSAGDAECVVYYFGAGEGGDAQANAERWASQFTRTDGTPAALKTKTLQAGDADVVMVEVEGVYHGGPTMGGAPAPRPRADSMLLGAIAQGPDANWFFKFTGPAATVRAERAAFDGMVRSLKKSR